MRNIYILLTRSETALSKIVRFVTNDTYTHVSISFEENLQPLYSSSRKNGRTLFPAGPCVERFQHGYYRKHLHIPCALYKLEVDDEIYALAKQEAQQIINCASEYRFNIIGLLFCQLKIPFHRKGHYFCSQFVGEILCKSSALKFPKDTSLMRPSDYMRIPMLKCQFQGRLKDLIEDPFIFSGGEYGRKNISVG